MKRKNRRKIIRTIPLLDEESPLRPDPVLPPSLRYDGGLTLTYIAADEVSHVHVTFEGLDSFRVSVASSTRIGLRRTMASRRSRWFDRRNGLTERHEYESRVADRRR